MFMQLLVAQDEAVVTSYLDTRLLAMLAAAVVPLLVSLITKQTASDGLRSIVNIVATALTTVTALWVNPGDTPVTWQLAVNTFIASLITSFVAYKGVWKPIGVAGSVTAKTPNFGLGSPPTLQTVDKGAEDLGQVDNDPRE